jgi:hypothetical protein
MRSDPALGLTQPTSQWVLEVSFSKGTAARGRVKLATHHHLMPRLRISRAIPPTHPWSQMPSWGLHGQFNLYLYHIRYTLPLCNISLQQTPQSILQNLYSSPNLRRQINGDTFKLCNMQEWDMKCMNFTWKILRKDNIWETYYTATIISEWLLQKRGLNWIQVPHSWVQWRQAV